MKIYFDSDGVAADMDKYIDTYLPHIRNVSDEEFWAALSEIPNLFSKFEPFEDFSRVIRACMTAGHDVEWLTATPKPTKFLCTAGNDKRAWLAKHFPSTIPCTTISGGINKAQFLYVNPGSVLIDDYARNINVWNAAGGAGILHTSVDDTLKQLKDLCLI